ncbi:LUD domain-containing protein [Isoptericola sp. b441]|uniref:LUD domain-containing protein n=1 Tax=Actinotalea lenta TaxID=3064654 RepID=A0ABT9DDF6_9CELL|nr:MULTISPECIES: LUD domain-containing protein [unclassified Isoptericola]MDO8108414.1 LUD domain-containing protein [Isoptericola sp. b441]MDO8119832.1 LUD domain-containing protein [Isoptericola sp. b490]
MTAPSTARAEMLGRIRRALGQSRSVEVERHYHRTGALVAGSGEVLDLLAERLEDYRATVVRTDASAVPRVVADLLDVPSVAVPDGVPAPWLAELTAEVRRDEPALTHAELDDTAAVLTTCRVAIAETGTVVLDGGPGQGRRALTLLPDRHVVVVEADQVVHSVPDAIARLDVTRPLTWISGPSATSDVELVRVEGVHGPRDLRVVLVDG